MEEKLEYTKVRESIVKEANSQRNSCLDKKTEELAYIAVLASSRLEGGIPFHVKMAKQHGANRDEIKSAVLVGFSAVGNIVVQALPIALNAFDEE